MTAAPPTPDSPRSTGLKVGLVLLVVLLAVNGIAVWSVFSARRSATVLAREDLQLQTRVHARSLEALLANLRADLLFLSQAPPLIRHADSASDALDATDPMARRWLRLDAEGTLLLFLQANPAVTRIEVRDPEAQRALLIAGRRGGAPLMLPSDSLPSALGRLVRGSWPVGASGLRLNAWVEPAELMSVVAPGLEDRLQLRDRPPDADDDSLRVAAHVRDDQWATPVAWYLVREERGSQVLRSFERLSSRYRTTLLVNAGVVLLTLVLAGVAFRQVTRAARLEAENRQQAQVRELERRLMHSERLAGVGRLAAGMAHEINNPLEGMSNYLRLLEDDLEAGDLDAAVATAPKLREGLERSAGVVRQVLAFSDPGKAPKAKLDLRRPVDDAFEFVAKNPDFSAVEFRRVLPDEPVFALGNATVLGQLFLNLVLNAAEVQLDGGGVEVVVVTETETTSDTEPDTGRAVVTVSDDGPGFDDDALEHLFEPFYSGRGSSGLGLSVCHGIVRDHGGTITAANRPSGRGAVVRVELPRAPTHHE